MVMSLTLRGGGTGFSIKGKSGKQIIATNAHVCDVADANGFVLIKENNGKNHLRKVIEKSIVTDLCAIEGVDDIAPLSLGEEPNIGDEIVVVGHPSLKPLALTKGEVLGKEDVSIPEAIVGLKDGYDFDFDLPIITRDQCLLPKNSIEFMPKELTPKIKLFKPACINIIRNSIVSSIHVQPGSSGSPVVDFWGNVVAVVFAKDEYNWASLVSHKDLSTFLKRF
jgi:S1-C subfamily serine protease